MSTRERNTRMRAVHRELGRTIEPNGDVLTIAVVNNMPDSALRATERQFCALLGTASEGRLLKLQFFSMPGVKRSAAAAAHVARYYEDFAELHRNPPDGIVVTGAEPRAATLQQEPVLANHGMVGGLGRGTGDSRHLVMPCRACGGAAFRQH